MASDVSVFVIRTMSGDGLEEFISAGLGVARLSALQDLLQTLAIITYPTLSCLFCEPAHGQLRWMSVGRPPFLEATASIVTVSGNWTKHPEALNHPTPLRACIVAALTYHLFRHKTLGFLRGSFSQGDASASTA